VGGSPHRQSRDAAHCGSIVGRSIHAASECDDGNLNHEISEEPNSSSQPDIGFEH
jgi:hypothetical protein